jgi:hypothetical protein
MLGSFEREQTEAAAKTWKMGAQNSMVGWTTGGPTTKVKELLFFLIIISLTSLFLQLLLLWILEFQKCHKRLYLH